MGKIFSKEIEHIFDTYLWALSIETKDIEKFIVNSQTRPLLIVGSGGSMTAASSIALLHQAFFGYAAAITPLNLISMPQSIRNNNIMILSASGRNSDVLNAYKKCTNENPNGILTFCFKKNSPLKKLTIGSTFTNAIEYDLPTGKDGFLATNSVIASIAVFAKAYYQVFQKKADLISNLKTGNTAFINDEITKISKKTHWIGLYSDWGYPAAVDAESKFSESGLASFQISDYRNFGHGRHYWLARHSKDSVILAFITNQNRDIANKTLQLIPKDIPIVKILTQLEGINATLDLIQQLMFFLNDLSNSKNIDIGRPHVPPFGRKIYHLKLKNVNTESDRNSNIILSKSGYASISVIPPAKLILWEKYYKTFVNNLNKANYGAIIFDYDGTLSDTNNRYGTLSDDIVERIKNILNHGIYVGIATGRGRSVNEILRKIIPKKHWRMVIIGYYNCAEILSLEKEIQNHHAVQDPNIENVSKALKTSDLLSNDVTINTRPHQITIEPIQYSEWFYNKEIVKEIVSLTNLPLKVFESSHSIDIVPTYVSKKTIIDYFKNNLLKNSKYNEVLCIGDMGNKPGNDYELLTHKHSLSVNTVSPNPESCWNLTLPTLKGTSATLYYLDSLKLINSLGFRINAERTK